MHLAAGSGALGGEIAPPAVRELCSVLLPSSLRLEREGVLEFLLCLHGAGEARRGHVARALGVATELPAGVMCV